mmetsp:Transcript_9806/g.23085  ORF Transcript_9806/g.23085 Transcript_9806/m.23085 type:complete len:230 (-) Transcript_9806:37-726(-)
MGIFMFHVIAHSFHVFRVGLRSFALYITSAKGEKIFPYWWIHSCQRSKRLAMTFTIRTSRTRKNVTETEYEKGDSNVAPILMVFVGIKGFRNCRNSKKNMATSKSQPMLKSTSICIPGLETISITITCWRKARRAADSQVNVYHSWRQLASSSMDGAGSTAAPILMVFVGIKGFRNCRNSKKNMVTSKSRPMLKRTRLCILGLPTIRATTTGSRKARRALDSQVNVYQN